MENKAPRSGAIKKGSMPQDDITRVAEELTKGQLTTTGQAIKTYKCIVEKKAPKIEPVEHGDYGIYAEYIKAHCKEHETYEASADELNKLFPQLNHPSKAVTNLKRSHCLSYRRVENGNKDSYIFFVEPTREELMKGNNKLKQLYDQNQNKLKIMQSANNQTYTALSILEQSHLKVKEENSQIKSDLFYYKTGTYISLFIAIVSVLSILLK